MNARTPYQPKYAQCRSNARLCALLAKDAATLHDRLTLLEMQKSWLALAENEEWLAGQRPSAPSRDYPQAQLRRLEQRTASAG
jgi:hypothetical protein